MQSFVGMAYYPLFMWCFGICYMLVTGPFLVSCSLKLTPGVSKQTSPIFRGLDALRLYNL